MITKLLQLLSIPTVLATNFRNTIPLTEAELEARRQNGKFKHSKYEVIAEDKNRDPLQKINYDWNLFHGKAGKKDSVNKSVSFKLDDDELSMDQKPNHLISLGSSIDSSEEDMESIQWI